MTDLILAKAIMTVEGTWNRTREYTPLSIVTYQNQSFISKQSVPAGMLLSNTAYWHMLIDNIIDSDSSVLKNYCLKTETFSKTDTQEKLDTKLDVGTRISNSVKGLRSSILGNNNEASGVNSVATGENCVAKGKDSKSMGYGCKSYGTQCYSEGYETIAGQQDPSDTDNNGNHSHAEGRNTHATGFCSHAEGGNTTASGKFAHAEGESTQATRYGTHAEGYKTQAIGGQSHAEGWESIASGLNSHSEGKYANATALCSHAEGMETYADNSSSHAEGYGTHASGDTSHAEGNRTIALGSSSHSGGYESKSVEHTSFSHGYYTTTGSSEYVVDSSQTPLTGTIASTNNLDSNKVLLGFPTNHFTPILESGIPVLVSKSNSTTKYVGITTNEGSITNQIISITLENVPTTITFSKNETILIYHTIKETSESPQHPLGSCSRTVFGRYNSAFGEDDTFIIGKGTAENNRSNAFRVTNAGDVFGKSSYNSTGADYAEYFEWQDGNIQEEDRVGYFVTLLGDKIAIASENDYILGIVSGLPSMIGNSDEDWAKRYLRDDFGRFITDIFTTEVEHEEFYKGDTPLEDDDDSVQMIKELVSYKDFVNNPDYDDSRIYVPRANRKEWSAIGMLGVLAVRDDGSCIINGYCKCNAQGIATNVDTYGMGTFRVIKRISENIIQIIVK